MGGGLGGGIVNAGTLTIRRSTIARNAVVSGEAYAEGGILNGGRLAVSDSTISQNRARGDNGGSGGGIANGSDYGAETGDVILEATTVTGNLIMGRQPRRGHRRVRGLRGPGQRDGSRQHHRGQRPRLRGAFTSAGYNLIGVAGPRCRGFEEGVADDRLGTPTDPIDPRLWPLARNGGPTATHALRAARPPSTPQGAVRAPPGRTSAESDGRRMTAVTSGPSSAADEGDRVAGSQHCGRTSTGGTER